MTTPSSPAWQKNLRALCRYNFFNSFALSFVASSVMSDLLFLRMGFRTEQFAYAKSAMFLVPPICYELLAGYLQTKNHDKLVCIWCYALRVTVPLLLPIMALCTSNRQVLFWTAVFVFSSGFTFAAFANNSLNILYRKHLPQDGFSRYSAWLFLLWNLPCSICSLPVACLLERWAHFPDRKFFLLVLAVEASVALFEIPAILSLIRLEETAGAERPYRPSLQENLAPLREPGYRKVLWMKLLHSMLVGFLVSFVTIYFLKVAHFSVFWLMLITISMSFASMGLSVACGKFMDRQGYRRWLTTLAFVMLVTGLVFAAGPTMLAAQLLFLCLLGSDGQSGLAGNLMTFMMSTTIGKFAPRESVTSYVAASNLIGNLGTFVACIGAGLWYNFLEARLPAHEPLTVFRIYFLSCNLLPTAMLVLLCRTGNWDIPDDK